MKIGKAIAVLCAFGCWLTCCGPIVSATGAQRELVTSFGSEKITGLAVNLETGNVYVGDWATQTVHIYGPTGGAPVDGVPSKIEEVPIIPHEEHIGMAIDNSCYEHQPRLTGRECEEYDPSYGDLYITDHIVNQLGIQKYKLNSQHQYESAGEISTEITLPDGSHNSVVWGLAVDSRGDIFTTRNEEPLGSPIVEFKKTVEKVISGSSEEIEEKLKEYTLLEQLVRNAAYLAVDGHGHVYTGSLYEGPRTEKYYGVAKLGIDEGGHLLSEEILVGNHPGATRALAVDSTTGAVFGADQSRVEEYDGAGTFQLTFGSQEPLGGSLGTLHNGVNAIAVNGGSELVYVANPLHEDVDVFGAVVGPPVFASVQPSVSGITRTSALLAGSVNPESKHATDYFEYVPADEYEPSAGDPYVQGGRTAVTELSGAHALEPVERVVLTGLRPGETYHYRMVVTNVAATEYGPDETFTTSPATPPLVSTGPALGVGATAATLTGSLNPRGLATSYVFEIGTDTSYGGARLFGNVGSSTVEVPVSVALQYLIPGTTYHYRLAATSFDGTSQGQDGTFTTRAVAAPLAQPSAAALLAAPTGVFPSIAGAIDKPAGQAGSGGSRARRRATALRVCDRQRSKSRRARCRSRVRAFEGSDVKRKHSTKR